jgi:hypothetical protein
MNFEARKLKIVEDFLRINDSSTIDKLEILLKKERIRLHKASLRVPLSKKQLNTTVEKAEEDSKVGRIKNAKQLRKEIQSWH